MKAVNVVKNNFFRSLVVIVVLAFLSTLVAPLVSVNAVNPNASAKTHKLDEIQVKFADYAEITLSNGKFVSQSAVDTTAVNSILGKVAVARNRSFTDSPKNISEKRQELKAKTGKQLADLNSYFTIKVTPGVDSTEAVTQLNLLPYVSDAYFAPLPTPAPTTPDYSARQTYRLDAPTGMGVNTVDGQPGVKGDAVQLVDIEYAWNTGHEDITDTAAPNSLIANGTPNDPFNDDNHGTAVTGITNGDQNGYGVNGIVPSASLKRVNANNVERGWDLANSIYVAQAVLGAGDVMLIEQQAWGPNNSFAPAEWVPAVYDAITYATAKGIIVIEGSGNGSQSLDDPIFYGAFTTKPNSGAIIVGAGAACGYQANRSRISYSNYGTRVDVQGWGECVTTTGYGYLSGLTKNEYYTNSFNGTSSASALVAAVAAAISSAKEIQFGIKMTSTDMRNLLVTTGTAQDTSVNGKIGPLPNLSAALADKTAPSAPSGLTVVVPNATSASLKWNAATDNVGIKQYQIYRNGVLLTVTATLNYTDLSLKKNTAYTYSVKAVDFAGNVSLASNSVTVKTAHK